jgi:hypothetical protein
LRIASDNEYADYANSIIGPHIAQAVLKGNMATIALPSAGYVVIIITLSVVSNVPL